MGFQWTDEELQAVLDKLGTSPDIHYMAVTDEEGRVLAASDTLPLGSELVAPEDMAGLAPDSQRGDALWRFPEERLFFRFISGFPFASMRSVCVATGI